jgi:hypothetical protein
VRSGLRAALARRLALQVRAELRDRDAGDSAAVEVVADQFLNVRDAKVMALAADLYQQFLDAGVMAVVLSLGRSRSSDLGQQFVYHVAHPPIIGDLVSRLQVMTGVILPRETAKHGQLACSLSMR